MRCLSFIGHNVLLTMVGVSIGVRRERRANVRELFEGFDFVGGTVGGR